MSNQLILTGRLASKLPVESGEGRNGPWSKRSFIIELPSNYPTSVCVVLWGERISMIDNFQEGDQLQVYIDIASREFNGRWYTDVRAWKIEPVEGASAGAQPPSVIPETAVEMKGDIASFSDDSPDDLPF